MLSCATWTAVSIAVPLASVLTGRICPTTIPGKFIVPSGLRYIVLRGLRKTEFGGASVSFVLMIVGAVLERVWKRTTETWTGARFLGLAMVVRKPVIECPITHATKNN